MCIDLVTLKTATFIRIYIKIVFFKSFNFFIKAKGFIIDNETYLA